MSKPKSNRALPERRERPVRLTGIRDLAGKVFARLDLDASGDVSLEELRIAVRRAGLDWQESQIDTVFSKITPGPLKLEEFRVALHHSPPEIQDALRDLTFLTGVDLVKNHHSEMSRRPALHAEAQEVLEFWFPRELEGCMDLWFGKSSRLDSEIQTRFGDLVERALDSQLEDWIEASAFDCLALIILLDQFSRNIFRNDPKMYYADSKAQAILSQAMFYNYHHVVSPLHAVFFCLVLTHAEQIESQNLCLEMWSDVDYVLASEDPLRIFSSIFSRHQEVIQKYGRFPHRNQILDRATTEEEGTFLEEASFRFDWPLSYHDGKVSFHSFQSH